MMMKNIDFETYDTAFIIIIDCQSNPEAKEAVNFLFKNIECLYGEMDYFYKGYIVKGRCKNSIKSMLRDGKGSLGLEDIAIAYGCRIIVAGERRNYQNKTVFEERFEIDSRGAVGKSEDVTTALMAWYEMLA